MSTQHNWTIRSYKEGDEEQIFELRKAVHPERQLEWQQWLKWWQWKYNDVPAGSNTWLADDNGKVVAQNTGIIMNLKVGKQTVNATQLVDASTHPDYRRQGIMLEITKTILNDLAKSDIHILIGFPNYKSFQKNLKLGYFLVDDRRKMVRVFNWENTLRARISNKLLLKLSIMVGNFFIKVLFGASKCPVIPGLTINRISEFDDRIDDFWVRVAGQFEIIVERSRDYLNWRYVAVPDIEYTIYTAEKAGAVCGYIVLRVQQEKEHRTAVIFDLLAESQDIARCLLSSAEEYSRKNDADYIYWIGIAARHYLRAFHKSGFISQPFIKKGELQFNARSSAPHISKEFLMNSHNWLIQMGDSDIL